MKVPWIWSQQVCFTQWVICQLSMDLCWCLPLQLEKFKMCWNIAYDYQLAFDMNLMALARVFGTSQGQVVTCSGICRVQVGVLRIDKELHGTICHRNILYIKTEVVEILCDIIFLLKLLCLLQLFIIIYISFNLYATTVFILVTKFY